MRRFRVIPEPYFTRLAEGGKKKKRKKKKDEEDIPVEAAIFQTRLNASANQTSI